jgi:hypothetical protein
LARRRGDLFTTTAVFNRLLVEEGWKLAAGELKAESSGLKTAIRVL